MSASGETSLSSYTDHAKTDLADAHLLAAMPAFGSPGFDPAQIPAPKSHAL